MWQLQWMLGLLPEWFWTTLLIAGLIGLLASFILKRIPFISQYRYPIQLVSIIFTFVGVYYQGGIDNEAKWQAKVKEMEDRVAAAQVESAAANKEIETKVVTKTKVVKEKGQVIYQYIDREVVKDKEVIKFVENCPIPSVIINTLNAAAKNQPVEEKK
jgi:hypothetical protein